jgi:hypothetical protein
MRDLVEHTAIMIVYPKPLPGTYLTPSPFMDKLKRQAAELNEAQYKLSIQQLLEEESNHEVKQRGKARKAKPGKAKPVGECSE